MNNPKPDTDKLTASREVLADIIKSIVRRPEMVSVTKSVIGTLAVLVIKTSPDDAGRLMGKGGKHFKSMTLLFGRIFNRDGLQVKLVYDEKSPPLQTISHKSGSPFGSHDAKAFKDCESIMLRFIKLLTSEPEKAAVSIHDFNLTAIFEIKIAGSDYENVYGPEVGTSFGPVGQGLDAIKSILDGVGKNYGRATEVVLTKV